MLSAICFNLDQSKILSPGNGLKTSLSLGFYTYNLLSLLKGKDINSVVLPTGLNSIPNDKILD